MLPPPPPGAGRAVLGFPIGGVVLLVITAIFRGFFQGINAYLIDVHIFGKFFAGWFWKDESTFMIFLLGGALGFLWGAGMTYDFSKVRPARVKRTRIPVDPDAPPDLDRNLIAPLFEAIPSLLVVTVVLGIVLALLGVLPLALNTSEQTTNEAATTGEYGNSDFNLLGLLSFDGTNQVVLFIGFAAVVLGVVVGTGVVLALLFYNLNREVRTVEVKQLPAGDTQDFLPIRLAAFFTDWALDVLNAVSAVVKTR